MRHSRCYAACVLLLLVSASLQAHANAVAHPQSGARSMSLHGLVRQLQELGGVKGENLFICALVQAVGSIRQIDRCCERITAALAAVEPAPNHAVMLDRCCFPVQA